MRLFEYYCFYFLVVKTTNQYIYKCFPLYQLFSIFLTNANHNQYLIQLISNISLPILGFPTLSITSVIYLNFQSRNDKLTFKCLKKDLKIQKYMNRIFQNNTIDQYSIFCIKYGTTDYKNIIAYTLSIIFGSAANLISY